jgi:Holliday junction resolvasome RuvABC endonuclease subunit
MIRFVSIDSSLANTGVATGFIKTDGEIVVDTIDLHETSKSKSKQIRASSDTIARCKSTYDHVNYILQHLKPHVIFMETPSGSQNSSAMKSYGATCQLIGSLSPAPIQVTPNEVKMASTGNKTSSKKEMIEWASKEHPTVSWDCNKDGSLKNKNEHMADAIAIAYAGVKTAEFSQIKGILNNK